jgi:succinate-semialdehyde dehydrogenase / glutarate-semialdehyde dehydrogenase
MRISREETFGPVAPIFRLAEEKEVISLANDTEFGLAAYFFTRDLARAWRVGEALEFGIVGINAGITAYEGAPFGASRRRASVARDPGTELKSSLSLNIFVWVI